jgi:glycosyltransferase involved in cell wall biosynthesis
VDANPPPPTPRVSIVVPTRNRLTLLRRVLDALAGQEGIALEHMEVIVVVDGATDGTAPALHELRPRFRLRVVEQVRSGPAAARNAGWRLAGAELVLFLDDDVIACPSLVAEHLRAHGDRPGAVVLGRLCPDPSGERTAWKRYEEVAQEKKYAALAGGEAPSGIRLYSGNVSVARHLLERVDGFDTALQRNEDVDLGFRLGEAGAEFLFAPEAAGLHCGDHDFAAWRRLPSLYGRLDVHLYRTRGYGGGLPGIVACYHDRHPLNRLALRVALSHPTLNRWLGGLAGRVGLLADRCRLHRLSYAALSVLVNIRYWTGVRDGLRGNTAFWSMVRDTRRHAPRPYRRAAATQQR